MTNLLSLSRASRLIGVTRGELQKKLRTGELKSFEGKVAVTELLRVYPSVSMEKSPMIERVEKIKNRPMRNKPGEQPELPSAEVLVSRINAFSHVLIAMKSELNRHAELVRMLAQKLKEIGMSTNLRTDIHALHEWLLEEIEEQSDASADPKAQFFVKDAFLRIMAAHVKFIPSGHEFFVESSESVLSAAIRSGLSPDYGCSSGNCGSCKARVLSGDVRKTCSHDYVLSEQEKQMGYMLMCSNTAATDLVLEAAEAADAAALPRQEIRSTVKQLEHFTDDLIALRVQTPKTKTLRFMAGQRVKLTIAEDISAVYPIASCPCEGRNLEFHIPRSPANRFANTIFDGLQVPQMVTVTGPEGGFTLCDAPKSVLFIACNEGFAPVKSLIEHGISIDTIEFFHLYWLVSGPNGHYLHNLCRSWKDALDNFQYTPLTVETDSSAAVEQKQIAQALTPVIENHPDLSGFGVYVAGPEIFTKTAEAMLLEHKQAQLRLETLPA